MAERYWQIDRIGKSPLLVTPNVGRKAFQAWHDGDEIIVIDNNKSFASSSITSIEESDTFIPEEFLIGDGSQRGYGKRGPVLNADGDSVMWAWYKKLNAVSPKAYGDYYSKVNGYFVLDKVGDGVILAFRKVLEANTVISNEIAPCEKSEIERLDAMYEQRNGGHSG